MVGPLGEEASEEPDSGLVTVRVIVKMQFKIITWKKNLTRIKFIKYPCLKTMWRDELS